MHIGEGRLDVPEQWSNYTVNVFTAATPGMPGMSLTINRDRLPYAVAFEDFVADQARKASTQLQRFKTIGEATLEIDSRPARELEFTWVTQDAGPVHQLIVAVADGAQVLNMAVSCPGTMSASQLEEARRMLRSFRFGDAPASVEDVAEA